MIDPQFVRALIHRLRTPLAVVTSDLEYIDKKFPEATADRTLRNTKRIADVLSSIEALLDAQSLAAVAAVAAQFSEITTTSLSAHSWSWTTTPYVLHQSFEGILLKDALARLGAVLTESAEQTGQVSVTVSVARQP
jgi:signal transduction histidine kinase